MESIVKKMKELGFTAYESKAYVTLWRLNPATGYELSRDSSVPRSAIYDVMKRLELIGLVSIVSTNPKRYIPLPPEKMFELLESRFQDKIKSLKKIMSNFEPSLEFGHLWNIQGYKNMIDRAKSLINRAQKEIYLSIWRREVLQLKEELEKARERGIKIVIFSFTEIPLKIGRVFSYDLDEKNLETIWDHKIIIVIDREELLMGEADIVSPKKT
ncbi:MAG: TrmB family transcriptional regulator, partial [Fidelibacterota bacterium]